jgi:glycogen operon protein
MLGYRVMLLERQGAGFASPAEYPGLSLACVVSHDLPTFAGWWRSLDIAERANLGLVAAAGAASAAEQRAAERTSLAAAVAPSPVRAKPRPRSAPTPHPAQAAARSS